MSKCVLQREDSVLSNSEKSFGVLELRIKAIKASLTFWTLLSKKTMTHLSTPPPVKVQTTSIQALKIVPGESVSLEVFPATGGRDTAEQAKA